jgi:HTH-type transcriptional regulator/antitoxin HigA
MRFCRRFRFHNYDKKLLVATRICRSTIAPGILVGRLQNEGCIKYSMLNDLKEHYEIAI